MSGALSRARRALAGAVGYATLAALPGCSRPLSDEECRRLLDRYVELLLVNDRPEASVGEIASVQRQAREKAARDPHFAECSERVSRRAFECALGAENADKFEQCLL